MTTNVTASEQAVHADDLDRLRSARAFIFDMDGVLYRGSTPLPGVQDVFNALTLRGIPFLLATNNSMATPATYVQRMADMGVTITADQVQTSATATRDFLKEVLAADAAILAVGMPALAEQLTDGTSFRILTDDDPESEADAVVVGLDLTFTYDKLRRATSAIVHGARFIATNADATLPNEQGFQPGAGSIVAAIATASGSKPVVVGKPEPLMMRKAVEQLGVAASETVMVGDRLDTDIAAGHHAGLLTALVLTGVTRREDLARAVVLPDYVFADLPALLQGIVGHG